MVKKALNYRFLGIFMVVIISGLIITQVDYGQEANKSTKVEETIETNNNTTQQGYTKVTLPLESVENIDAQIEEYLFDLWPIMSDDEIEAIKGSKDIGKKLVNDTLGHVEFSLNINVPSHYLDPAPTMLWELNIPEFTSRIYQIYNNDTILITVWPNVVGAPSTKTYTGYYNIFRLRNWPTWKDPESDPLEPGTPPGPGNPLGLFAAHYDENSLRYFHGTNKNGLLKNEYRALSHGCVRNDNGNIDKMKKFIVKKMVTSQDISWWANSKKSMMYNFTEEEKQKFPVRIKYKTFEIGNDSYGDYIIFFKDVYGYARGNRWSKFDKEELMIFSTVENIAAEYKAEHKPNQFQLSDDKLIPIIESLIADHKDYEKYYFDDIVTGSGTK
ncbi:MAG TPA: L,D-transpeptidase family protein [Ignavibacteria bacterium]|nr:L,D-transpeptidase family protein [Ignavibacteria bacterium]